MVIPTTGFLLDRFPARRIYLAAMGLFCLGTLAGALAPGFGVLLGALVAATGAIGFVGPLVPHLVRLLLGPAHRALLPVSAVVGAIYLVLVDLVCRVLVSPAELPVGVVTSVLGAPVLLWLLGRGTRA